MAHKLARAASLRTARLRVDLWPTDGAGSEPGKLSLRTDFALRFGEQRDSRSQHVQRQDDVRRSFNSPFRPFVLATTSIGQESLDFHWWCHAVYHRNLPGNPVDLEQREGKVTPSLLSLCWLRPVRDHLSCLSPETAADTHQQALQPSARFTDQNRMLSIPAMVHVGPWTLVELSKSPEWTNCERCDRRIKEVWTCTVDADAREVLARLKGQQKWRVGSVCGPTLLEVSEQVWRERTAETTRRLRLLVRVQELIAGAASRGLELPAVVFERHALLLNGKATDKQLRHLGLLVGKWSRMLKSPPQ